MSCLRVIWESYDPGLSFKKWQALLMLSVNTVASRIMNIGWYTCTREDSIAKRIRVFVEKYSHVIFTLRVMNTFLPDSGTPSLLGVTIVVKYDYCDSIDIAGSTIAILLLLWTTIAILLRYYCLKHLCSFEGFVLFDLILYVHSTIFQLCGTVFLGWTSTKLG